MPDSKVRHVQQVMGPIMLTRCNEGAVIKREWLYESYRITIGTVGKSCFLYETETKVTEGG